LASQGHAQRAPKQSIVGGWLLLVGGGWLLVGAGGGGFMGVVLLVRRIGQLLGAGLAVGVASRH